MDTSWYKPGQKIKEFHASNARTRALMGGRGTGKTTAIAIEAIGHGFWNAGAKIYILRKTQDSNEDTTQATFDGQVFPNVGNAYVDTGLSLFKRIDGGRVYRIPSKKAAEQWHKWQQANPGVPKAAKLHWLDNEGSRLCSWIYFAGVPEARYRASRFRGYECSMLIFVEADQLEREDLDLGMACLRWKGADPDTCDDRGFIRDTCVILDSNPPSPRHWIAELEEESKDDPTTEFWHIATRENKHNLPPGYVEGLEKQYRKNVAMYKRMLLGEYAEAFDGDPVLYEFSESHAFDELPWVKGAYLVRGWDFGTTQAVIWSAYWVDGPDEYWWDLHEFYAVQSDAERQCKRVHEITNKVFPFWNDRSICSGIYDYCDPAGNAKTDKGSTVKVLRSHGFHPGFCKAGLQESLAIYNRLLAKKDRFGNFVYRIDKTHCPKLYTASLGGYRYPVQGEPGFGKAEPAKGARFGDFDHLADASRYPKYNLLRMLHDEAKTKDPVGPMARRVRPNRRRRYY